MAIYKITYSPLFRRANVHNYGCNFKCRGCSYKLKAPEPMSFLPLEKVKETLEKLSTQQDVERVHFVGGEPTTNPDLPELVRFIREDLKAGAYLGHTNGSNTSPDGTNGMTVSLKAYTDAIHIDYTGESNSKVLKNFVKAHRQGIEITASSIFIPGYIAYEEIEKIAQFVADVDPTIPYHIIGYVPVLGAPWRKPTPKEVKKSAEIAEKYLTNVTFSCLTTEDFLNLGIRDARYQSMKVSS